MAKTVIHDEQGNASWGGEDHLQAAQSRSFASLIFELLSEKIPTPEELKIFELVLNLSIDHGPETPSAQKVISEKGKGKSITEAVAAGILEINDAHGGAGEPLMELLYEVKSKKGKGKSLVEEHLKKGKRLPGFGHRLYKDDDPRVLLIFKQARELNVGIEYIEMIENIQQELEKQKGLRLPINIDGAIAAILCAFGWPAKMGKIVFIIARTPGLCGQYLNAK